MALKYVHQELDQEVHFPAGYYTPLKEEKIKHSGREVLYVVGYVMVESSCCGTANWSYALVPGYVTNWQSETSETGLPVSEVEAISDDEVRKEIRETIQKAEKVFSVEFW